MPYIKRYVQVLPATTPSQAFLVTHNLGNSDIASVEINTVDPAVQLIIPFTWNVINDDQVEIFSSLNLEGCWIVVRAA